jgi:predicted dinucleotide-binding enzyme
MAEKMILTIAVVGGTGKLGPGLAKRWAQAGYRVLIGSRKAEKAERIEGVVGYQNQDAAKQADIVVLTVKYTAHEAVIESLKDFVRDKIVVDTTARIDFKSPSPPTQPSAAAHRLKGDATEPLDLDVLVCSDSMPAVDEVIKLARAAGLRGYYAGGLENAIVIEGLTSILISMNDHYDSNTAAIAVRGIAV